MRNFPETHTSEAKTREPEAYYDVYDLGGNGDVQAE